METNDQIFAQKLIRYHAGMIDESEVHEAFSNAMKPRIKRLMAQKKRDVEEGLSAFLGAVGTAVGRGVAHEVGSAIGIKGSTITTLARAAFSKSKSTTKVEASKKPRTKTKKKAPVSSASSNTSHQPITKQSLFKANQNTATANPKTTTATKTNPMSSKFKANLRSSTAGFSNPMSATSNVTSIAKFKNANRLKIRKIHEEKPEPRGEE